MKANFGGLCHFDIPASAIAGVLALAFLWLGDTAKQHESIARDLIERCEQYSPGDVTS